MNEKEIYELNRKAAIEWMYDVMYPYDPGELALASIISENRELAEKAVDEAIRSNSYGVAVVIAAYILREPQRAREILEMYAKKSERNEAFLIAAKYASKDVKELLGFEDSATNQQ
jgi:nucleotide-binding universal stress UspA family protein